MAFERNNKLSVGRPKGSIGKRTIEVEIIAERMGINPFQLLLLFAKGDWKALGYDNEVLIKESSDGKSTFMEYTISPELRAQCARDACKYLYSQKKSVEHISHNALSGMTPEQKLSAMKQAVAMLEGELNEAKAGPA